MVGGLRRFTLFRVYGLGLKVSGLVTIRSRPQEPKSVLPRFRILLGLLQPHRVLIAPLSQGIEALDRGLGFRVNSGL